MNLYIRLENGQPFEHPILEANLLQAYPELNLNELPDWLARFTRLEVPTGMTLGPYEALECSYQMVDGVVTDVWAKRQFTEAEKLEKQRITKEAWPTLEIGKRFVSWVFNEDRCTFEAPVAMPTDGKSYYWSEATLSWVEVTPVMVLP
jgi:hypothetical protein